MGVFQAVFVTKLNDHLLVRLGDEWLTLKHYLRVAEAREQHGPSERAGKLQSKELAAQLQQYGELLEVRVVAAAMSASNHPSPAQRWNFTMPPRPCRNQKLYRAVLHSSRGQLCGCNENRCMKLYSLCNPWNTRATCVQPHFTGVPHHLACMQFNTVK